LEVYAKKQNDMKYFKGKVDENEQLEDWEALRQQSQSLKAEVTYLAQ